MTDDYLVGNAAATARRNYLTRLAAEKRRFPRRDCKLCLGFLATQKGVRSVTVGKIWLHNISESGALASSSRWKIPPHFYLFLGEFQYLIGCSVMSVEGYEFHLQFIKEQPTEFVDMLSRISDPFEFRDRIRLSMYGLQEPEKKR